MNAKRARTTGQQDSVAPLYSVAPVVMPGEEPERGQAATRSGKRGRPRARSAYMTVLLGTAVVEVLALLAGAPQTPLSDIAPSVAAYLGIQGTTRSAERLVALDANGAPEPPERWVAVPPVPLAHASLARLARPDTRRAPAAKP
jgi:hypothetical protein